MSKALVLTVVFLVCAVMLGIARYDAHYADRIHHSQIEHSQIGRSQVEHSQVG